MTQNESSPRRVAEAMEAGELKQFKHLLGRYPENLYSGRGLCNWLSRATIAGRLGFVKTLIDDLEVNVNSPVMAYGPEGVIKIAAGEGHVELVRWLLDKGAKINHDVDEQRRCLALTRAAGAGHLDVVKVLIERGADIHASWHGINALMEAQFYGHLEVTTYLESLGAQDIRATAPPDYPTGHSAIMEYLTGQRAKLGPWSRTVPGDPVVTLHSIPGSESHQETTVFTLGLSDRFLALAEDDYAATELRFYLPPDWQLDSTNHQWTWPIECLERIVRQLRDADRWPESPVFPVNRTTEPLGEGTTLCGWVAAADLNGAIQMPDYRWVDFHTLFPIHADERDLVEREGVQALLRRFQDRDVALAIDPRRQSVLG